MAKKILFGLVLLVAVLFGSGCFVSVRQDVDFPASRFAEARERISMLERHNPDRVGRVGRCKRWFTTANPANWCKSRYPCGWCAWQ